jgi:hypothetical protein
MTMDPDEVMKLPTKARMQHDIPTICSIHGTKFKYQKLSEEKEFRIYSCSVKGCKEGFTKPNPNYGLDEK